jgi:hypothetical protein
MTVLRQRIEAEIERLIGMLDALDGDPDLEPEPLEEQHDIEDVAIEWFPKAPASFVLAERARRLIRSR